MEIGQIIQRLQDTQTAESTVKTASDNTPAQATGAQLRDALRESLAAAPAQTKTASADEGQPAEHLIKMASDLAAAEDAAVLKQAQVYGAAVCDGFMARYGQYEKAAAEVMPQMPVKTAGADDSFEKFASENPQLVKEAYDLGYQTKLAALQKEAAEQFNAGYNDTMEEVHKLASAAYKHGSDWGTWAVKTADYHASRQQ